MGRIMINYELQREAINRIAEILDSKPELVLLAIESGDTLPCMLFTTFLELKNNDHT